MSKVMTKESMRLVRLTSVGCVLDVQTGFTYPEQIDGTPDLFDGMAVHVSEVCEEWLEALSRSDQSIVDKNSRSKK